MRTSAIKRISILVAALPGLCAAEGSTQGFEQWAAFDSPAGNRRLESLVREGWLGDRPPYLLPRGDVQMGPARLFRREGAPGQAVVAGQYALGVVTASNAVNVLPDCSAVTGSRQTRPEVSVWLRGSGQVRCRVYAYDGENRVCDIPFLGTFTVTPEWKQYRALYEPDRTQVRRWSVVLEIGPQARVDIDEVAIRASSADVAMTLPAGVPAPVPDREKVAVAFPAGEPIRVDGRPDETAWRTAEWHDGFVRHQNQAAIAPVQAQFAFLYDATHLYLAFVSAESGIATNGVKATPRGAWPASPAVEFFLDPGATRDAYYQFAANVLGCTYEGRRMDATWDCAWQAAGAADGTRWSVEAAIPFAAWQRAAPQPGELWSMNVCRGGPYQGPWAPVGPRYHSPEGFGLLTFGRYGDCGTNGFLSSSAAALRQLAARPAVASSPELAAQLRAAENACRSLGKGIASAGVGELDRARFLGLFHGAEQVRTQLRNVAREAAWLEALSRGEREDR